MCMYRGDMNAYLLFSTAFLSVTCVLGTMEGRVARSFDSCVNERCESTGTDIRFCSIQGRCESCSPSTCNEDVCRQWRGCQAGTTGELVDGAGLPSNSYTVRPILSKVDALARDFMIMNFTQFFR